MFLFNSKLRRLWKNQNIKGLIEEFNQSESFQLQSKIAKSIITIFEKNPSIINPIREAVEVLVNNTKIKDWGENQENLGSSLSLVISIFKMLESFKNISLSNEMGRIISMMGDHSVKFLVEVFNEVETIKTRRRIIAILKSMGSKGKESLESIESSPKYSDFVMADTLGRVGGVVNLFNNLRRLS